MTPLNCSGFWLARRKRYFERASGYYSEAMSTSIIMSSTAVSSGRFTQDHRARAGQMHTV